MQDYVDIHSYIDIRDYVDIHTYVIIQDYINILNDLVFTILQSLNNYML